MSVIPPATVVRGPGSHFAFDGKPKVAFPSKREAKAAARRALSGHGKHLLPYRCAECPRWHLAQPPRVKAKA